MQNQTFKLSLRPDDCPPNVPVIYCSQYDVGRHFVATIMDVNGAEWASSGETAAICGTKPDGTGFYYEASVNGATVSFDTTGQMTVVSGFVRCNIVLTKNSTVVGTLAFLLYVQPAGLTADTIISSDDFGSIITEAVTEWMDEHGFTGDISDAVNSWLEDHPEATTTVQDHSLSLPKFINGALGFVTPEMFGAVGDGTTDDAAAIQAAIDFCIDNGTKLIFSPTTYGVIPYQEYKVIVPLSSTLSAAIIKGSVEIDMNGATIKILQNSVDTYRVFHIVDSDGVTIKNGRIVGDRSTATILSQSGNNSKLIETYDSKRVILDNLVLEDSKGDNLVISGVQNNQTNTTRSFVDFYEGLEIRNCVLRHAVRHGMVIDKCRGATFYNLRVENVKPEGQMNWSGNAVDIEPYYGYGSIFDVRFIACSMTDNANGPFTQNADGVRWEECYLQDIDFRTATNSTVNNSIILGDAKANSSDVVFDGNTITGSVYLQNKINTLTQTGILPDIIIRNNTFARLTFDSRTDSPVIGNLVIKNNKINPSTHPVTVYGKTNGDTFTGIVEISENTVYREYDNSISNAVCVSASDIHYLKVSDNTFLFDIKTIYRTKAFDFARVATAVVTGNTLQRLTRQSGISYTSVLDRIFGFADVGMAFLDGNIVQPSNETLTTVTLTLIEASITGSTPTSVVLMNNYCFGVSSKTTTQAAISVLVDVGNVLNNATS